MGAKLELTPDEWENVKYINSPLSNSYGTVFVFVARGKFYFALGDWNDDSHEEISKEFYDAFVKEFGEAKTDGN